MLDQLFSGKFNVANWQRSYKNELDSRIIQQWRSHGLDRAEHLSLLALGGYGRGELYPYSDVDLSIIHLHPLSETQQQAIGAFIRSLWDADLQIGSNVLSYDEAGKLAQQDLNFMTAVLESRLLQGSGWNFTQVQSFVRSSSCFGNADFFDAKLAERDARWAKFQSSAHSLEPNLKNSPGALRDIHTLQWIARKYLHVNNLEALVQQGYLRPDEYRKLLQCWRVLAWLRIAVHQICKRADDRLIFQRQQQIASERGWQQQQLMQLYYRTAASVRALALLLLEDWQSSIIAARPQQPQSVQQLALDGLLLRSGQIDFVDSNAISKNPGLMLQAFVSNSKYPLSTHAIRNIYNHRFLLTENFRSQAHNQQAFLRIMSTPAEQLADILRLMQRCALLPGYLPAFKKVEGSLQYDLFHQYTVDSHSLRLFHRLRIIARQGDLVSSVYQEITDKLPLHLAMLFHDLGKGRGGNHSDKGARLVHNFCRQHGLAEHRAELAVWLVRQHLLLSQYAQTSDPEDEHNLQRFIQFSKVDREKLNALLVLTVVDIQATNDKLWNSWRQHLIYQFYQSLKQLLLADNPPLSSQQQLKNKLHKLKALLPKQSAAKLEALWEQMPLTYKLEQSIDSLQFATQSITQGHSLQLRHLTASPEYYELFVHKADSEQIFARLAAALYQQQLEITKASLHSDSSGRIWDSLIVSSSQRLEAEQLEQIEQRISAALEGQAVQEPVLGVRPRTSASFKTRCLFKHLDSASVLVLVTADRLGLLAWLAYQLSVSGISIDKAYCNTLGNRAEDQLHLSCNGGKLPEQLCAELKIRLVSQLDDK